MKFFIISEQGDASGLAWKLFQEGHDVVIYFNRPWARQALKGMVKQTPTITYGLSQKPDAIIFDMVGQGKLADQLKKDGKKVIGGGSWNDRLELDRRFAMRVMSSFGIKAPLSFAFDSLAEGMKFAKTHKRLLVLKPSNNMNTSYTYVPKNQDDLLKFMTHLINDLDVDGSVVLQEFIAGTEVSTEIWYAQGKPIPNPNSTFETKKLMVGDVGPATGCQTSVVFSYPNREPKIVQQSLKKINVFLERTAYTGPLDINGIVSNGRFYGLEFTPRFGYNALYAFLRLLDEPVGEMLMRVANGVNSPMKLKTGFGYSLRTSIPPYPYKPENDKLRAAVYGPTKDQCVSGLTNEEWANKVFPLDMYKDHSEFYTAGVDGVVCECTGYGDSVWAAEGEAIGLFKALSLPNKQARIGDGAKIAQERIHALQEQGYEVPPFKRPIYDQAMPTIAGINMQPVMHKEGENDAIQQENVDLANKLNVSPDAFADPRVKSN